MKQVLNADLHSIALRRFGQAGSAQVRELLSGSVTRGTHADRSRMTQVPRGIAESIRREPA